MLSQKNGKLNKFCLLVSHRKLLTVWRKCPSKASLSRRIRVLEESNMKFRQIGHITSQYGQSFFSPKTISAWNGLPFAVAPSLAVFRSNF